MKKVLFVATVTKKHINVFHLPYIEWFKKNGYETHVCSGNDFENPKDIEIPFCDNYHSLSFERSPFKFKNIEIYSELKKIIDSNNFDVIHCHTPMGGALARLASRSARKKGTKVFYTAHGFHFFEGAPLKNWLIYFPIEKYLSYYTDTLITINKEDYRIAKRRLNAKNTEIVKGVGVNFRNFESQTYDKKSELRKMYGYSDKDFILIYVGELSFRKHQDLLIDAIYELSEKYSDIKLLLVGEGEFLEKYRNQTKQLKIENQVEFLGFRKDISNLMILSDVAVSSSRQEGLPVNVMEAMATGLSLIVTDCRGNRDLVKDGINGMIVSLKDKTEFAKAIETQYKSTELRKSFGEKNLEIASQYSITELLKEMEEVYRKELI